MAAPGQQDRGEDVGGWPVPPIGRVGQASTWPPRRCFFASDQTGLITGTTLLADGAMTAGHCSVNGTGGTSRTCVRARLYQDGGCAPPRYRRRARWFRCPHGPGRAATGKERRN